MKFIPELAGLRGLAAFMVFIAHAASEGFFPRVFLNGYGRLGLGCFFILSGYLIAQIYLDKKFNKDLAYSYLMARLSRILPLYFFVIIASFFISNFIYSGFHYDLRDNLKFVLSLLLINTPYEPWTIPVEVQFYFCFMIFWWLYSYKIKEIKWLLLFPLILMIPSLFFASALHRLPKVMGSFAAFFFIGIFISMLQNRDAFSKIYSKIPQWFSLLLLFLFAIGLPMCWKQMGFFYTRSWYDPIFLTVTVVLFTLIISRTEHFTILRFKPLVFMSEISYGFYLIHRPVMKLFVSEWGSIPTVLITVFATSVMIAYTLFKLIELPSRKYIDSRFNGEKQKLLA